MLIYDPDRPDVGDLEGVHVALGYAVRLDEGRSSGTLDADGLDSVQEAAAPVAQVVVDDGPVVVFYGQFQEFLRLPGRQVLQVCGLLYVRRVPVGPARSPVHLVAGQAVLETEYRLSFGRRRCTLLLVQGRIATAGRVASLPRVIQVCPQAIRVRSRTVSITGPGTLGRMPGVGNRSSPR